jgi:hypothetical protein
MPLPTVIHSQVDPAAITKVTRLFNNTLVDTLAHPEFAQSRRDGHRSRCCRGRRAELACHRG